MADTKWKDFLLKSGVPLEFDVYNVLEKRGCISSFDYSYWRANENKIINEFSFDIDSSYIKMQHFFELMIECKYRDPSTNWLFIPGDYGGPSEFDNNAFLHPLDFFTKLIYPFSFEQLPPLAPACLKGIELLSDNQNPKSITQAVHQLSYGMAEHVVSALEHQYERLLGNKDFVFYTIPIIVTTANLYRMKAGSLLNS